MKVDSFYVTGLTQDHGISLLSHGRYVRIRQINGMNAFWHSPYGILNWLGNCTISVNLRISLLVGVNQRYECLFGIQRVSNPDFPRHSSQIGLTKPSNKKDDMVNVKIFTYPIQNSVLATLYHIHLNFAMF